MGAVKIVFGFFRGVLGVPMYFLAAALDLAEGLDYTLLKKKSFHSGLSSFADWVLPYEEESYWDKRAKDFKAEVESGSRGLPVPLRHALEKKMLDAFNKLEFSSAVEVGCGYGKNLKILSDSFSGKSLEGIDISKGMLSNAAEHLKLYHRVKVSKGDAASLPFNGNSFDAVFSSETLMHVPKEKIAAAANEMIRVSKKYVVLFEPDLSRTPFLKRLAHAQHIFFHNYMNLFLGTGKVNVYWVSPADHKFRSAYIFKKIEGGQNG